MILPRRGQVTDSSPRALSLDVLGERLGVLEGQVRSFEAQSQVVAPPDEHVAGEPGGACAHDTIVSLLFLHDGDPVLLSEIGVGGASLKKIALTSTNFRWVQVGSDPAIWISGHEHVVVFPRRPLLRFMVRGVSIVVSLAEEATSRVRAVLDTACRPQPGCVQGEMRPE